MVERWNTAGGRIKQRGRRGGGWVEPKKQDRGNREGRHVKEHMLREEEEKQEQEAGGQRETKKIERERRTRTERKHGL